MPVNAFDVNVVHSMPIDVDGELRQAVEPALGGPPIEAVAPVFDNLSQNLARHAPLPSAFTNLVRPSGQVKTQFEICHIRICNANSERRDFHEYSQPEISEVFFGGTNLDLFR
jgi:hypothetical protein